MDGPTITLHFQPTRDETGELQREQLRRVPRRRLAGIAALLVVTPIVTTRLMRFDKPHAWSVIGSLAIMATSVWILWDAVSRIRALRAAGEERTLSDAGVEWRNAEDASFLPWDRIEHCRETPHQFLLVAGQHVIAVPKRVVPPAQLEQVRSLLRRHLDPARLRMLPARHQP